MSLTVVPTPGDSTPHRAAGSSWSLYGHNDEALSASAHKNLFATCSVDGVALIWRVGSGRGMAPENVCRVSTGGPAILDICFVDDRRVATAQGDACVSLWDIETGKRTGSLSRGKVPGRSSWPVLNAVTMVAQETLCFGGDDGYMAFADVRASGVTSSINHRAPITALKTVEDGSLFCGDACGHVGGLDQRMSWRRFMDVKCASDAVASVTCGAKGDQAVVYTMDGKASLLDTQPFAVDQQERLLTTITLSYGESRTIRRGDWSDVLDAIVLPTGDGNVACVAPSRFSAGSARSLRSTDIAVAAEGDEGEEELFFAKVVQDKYVLFGGAASLSLREL